MSLYKEIMKNVGIGPGFDYEGLGVRLDGSTAYVEGRARSHGVIEEYADKVKSTEGVENVVISAIVFDGGDGDSE